MKKQIIFIGFVAVVVITATFIYVSRENVSVLTSPLASTGSTSSPQATSQATFKVGDTTYSIEVTHGETVIDAMRALASTSDFAYTGKDYPGLGVFVDSITGKKNGNNMYWILYINGTVSTSGASVTVLGAGDTVEWKYEKSF